MATVPLTLPRSPHADARTLQQQQLLQQVLNPLIRAGIISSVGTTNYSFSNLFFTGGGVPAETLAFVGDYYLDLSSGDLYLKS